MPMKIAPVFVFIFYISEVNCIFIKNFNDQCNNRKRKFFKQPKYYPGFGNFLQCFCPLDLIFHTLISIIPKLSRKFTKSNLSAVNISPINISCLWFHRQLPANASVYSKQLFQVGFYRANKIEDKAILVCHIN